MTNKNQLIIMEGIEKNISLKELKLSSNYKGIILTDITIEEIIIENGDFENAQFNNVIFNNVSFLNSFFDNSVITNCQYKNCKFENTEFIDTKFNKVDFFCTSVKNIIFERCTFDSLKFKSINSNGVDFLKCSILNTSFLYSDFESLMFINVKFKEVNYQNNIFKNSHFIKVSSENVFFLKNNFNKSEFYSLSIEHIKFEENVFNSVNMIKCENVSQDIIKKVIDGGGRKEYLIIYLLKKPLFSSLILISFIILSFIIYQFIAGDSFRYMRYILNETWRDPYRDEIAREAETLFFLTFKDFDIKKTINQALIEKKHNNLKLSGKYFTDAYLRLENSPKNIQIFLWLINEIHMVTNNEADWNICIGNFEKHFPEKNITDLWLFLVKIFHRKGFINPTMEVLEKYLLFIDNDTDKFCEMLQILHMIPMFHFKFKPRALQKMRSFAIRKGKQNKELSSEYNFIKENIEESLEYYYSMKEVGDLRK